jgi:hypothetical protein
MQTFQPSSAGREPPPRVDHPAPGSLRRPPGPPQPSENAWSTRLGRAAAQWGRRIARTVLVIGLAAIGRRIGFGPVATVVIATVAWVSASGGQRRQRNRRRRIVGFGAVTALMVVLAATTWSYTGYLNASGAATFSVRTSDWMRDHGMSAAVDRIEQYLYDRNGPTNGIVTSSQLPTMVHGGTSGAAANPTATGTYPVAVALGAPAPITSLIDHSLVGEGQWKPNFTANNGNPATYTTYFRPDAAHTEVLAAAVWLDPSATKLVYVPGSKSPGGTGWAWGSGIPRSQRNKVIAAFNSGFKFKDTAGGVFIEGRTVYPLRDGEASLVIHAN